MISDSVGAGERQLGMCLSDVAEHLHGVLRPCDAKLRLEILVQLIVGPLDVTMLCTVLALEKSLVSRYLGELRDLGVLWCRKERNRHIFSVTSAVQVEIGSDRVLITMLADDHLGFALIVPRTAFDRVRAERGVTDAPLSIPPRTDAAVDPVTRVSISKGQRFSVVVRPARQRAESHAPMRPGE